MNDRISFRGCDLAESWNDANVSISVWARISRPKLLASKALFDSVLLILPIVVQSIVLRANGVTLREAARAIPRLLVAQLSWIVCIAVLAVLTPSFGRFALAIVIYFIMSLS